MNAAQNTRDARAIFSKRIWFSLARVAWLGLAILTIAFYVMLSPARYSALSNVSANDAAALVQLNLSSAQHATFHLLAEHIAFVVFTAIAIFIFLQARDAMMLLAATFLLMYLGPNANGANVLQLWFIEASFAISTALFCLLFIFPDGRIVPRWTRWIVLLWVLWELLRLIPFTLNSSSSIAPSASNPIFLGIELSFLLLGLFAQIYRYRRVSTPTQRQQTKWVVFGLAIVIVGFIFAAVPRTLFPALTAEGAPRIMYGYYNKGLLVLTRLALPITLALAMLRYRLWDIDVIINRALVYGALTVLVIGLYVLGVGVFGAVLNLGNNFLLSLFVTGMIAVLFQPLRARLQRGVNRLMYGERDEPYAVLQKLGQRLETTLAPDAVLPAIVETVAQTLKLPYAAIELKDEGRGMKDEIIASHGEITTNPRHSSPITFPLLYQHERVGSLIVAPRAGEETFSDADKKLLDDFARQASIAVHAVRLTTALQISRERLVTAREEERRRIRRDLHDGLGPQLATLAMEADTAREYAHSDSFKTEALLQDITARTQNALQDIRRLVYNLRPPALDEMGLVGALRAYAATLEHDLRVSMDAPEPMPPLSAAAEVAAYRIIQEALTNVVKHANAKNCKVQIVLARDSRNEIQALEMVIQDDGTGLPQAYTQGVGLNSMRERAEELGGMFSIERLEQGTRVAARLPLES